MFYGYVFRYRGLAGLHKVCGFKEVY